MGIGRGVGDRRPRRAIPKASAEKGVEWGVGGGKRVEYHEQGPDTIVKEHDGCDH